MTRLVVFSSSKCSSATAPNLYAMPSPWPRKKVGRYLSRPLALSRSRPRSLSPSLSLARALSLFNVIETPSNISIWRQGSKNKRGIIFNFLIYEFINLLEAGLEEHRGYYLDGCIKALHRALIHPYSGSKYCSIKALQRTYVLILPYIEAGLEEQWGYYLH